MCTNAARTVIRIFYTINYLVSNHELLQLFLKFVTFSVLKSIEDQAALSNSLRTGKRFNLENYKHTMLFLSALIPSVSAKVLIFAVWMQYRTNVDGRIILRWIFRKWEGIVETGCSWLRIWTVGGHL